MDVVSFNEVSRVRRSVNRDSERTYGCVPVTFRDETSLAANGCSGISAVDLPYLFTVMNS